MILEAYVASKTNTGSHARVSAVCEGSGREGESEVRSLPEMRTRCNTTCSKSTVRRLPVQQRNDNLQGARHRLGKNAGADKASQQACTNQSPTQLRQRRPGIPDALAGCRSHQAGWSLVNRVLRLEEYLLGAMTLHEGNPSFPHLTSSYATFLRAEQWLQRETQHDVELYTVAHPLG